MLLIAIIPIYILMLIAGIGYAIYIYHNPPKSGRTYWSVAVGVGVTLIGITLANVVTLVHGENLWLTIANPLICFALTGLPMAAGQELKRRKQNYHNDNLEKVISNGL